jgi:hypothetical protein
MLKKFFACLIAASCAFSSVSCATIVSGRTQKVPVTTVPDGATVTMDTATQKSPATMLLDRRQPFYVIKIEKEGYKTVTVTLKRGNNGWLWGNILFGGVIGLVIDFATNSAYKFTPQGVNMTLVENTPAAQ